jgi:hypothetical protein
MMVSNQAIRRYWLVITTLLSLCKLIVQRKWLANDSREAAVRDEIERWTVDLWTVDSVDCVCCVSTVRATSLE